MFGLGVKDGLDYHHGAGGAGGGHQQTKGLRESSGLITAEWKGSSRRLGHTG